MNKKDFKSIIENIWKAFLKWQFGFSLRYILASYVGLISTVIALGVSLDLDYSISEIVTLKFHYSELSIDWTTIIIITIITIFYIIILIYRNKENISLENNKKKNFVHTTSIIEKVLCYFDMPNYPKWTYHLGVSGEIRISIKQFENLTKVRNFCSNIQELPQNDLNTLLTNLAEVVSDIQTVFNKHSHYIPQEIYEFEKIHTKVKRWDDNEYGSLLNEYIEECCLIGDLTYEMTRLLNQILTTIRKEDNSFKADYGLFRIDEAESPMVFQDEEMTGKPYPGLKKFITERYGRKQHINDNKNEKNIELLIGYLNLK